MTIINLTLLLCGADAMLSLYCRELLLVLALLELVATV
jgi:hypothetical protein